MKQRLLHLSIVLLIFMGGCQSNEKFEEEIPSVADEQTSQGEEGSPMPENGNIEITRKLIKQGFLEYRVEDMDAERKKIKLLCARYKAYISGEVENNAYNRKSSTLVVRVPASSFDSLVSEVCMGIDVFERKEIEVKDVTEEYVDVAARLKTKKELEQRYLQLLKKAGTVQEMLEIERELGTLRSEIESIEGRLNVLKNEIGFSTLTLNMFKTVEEPVFFGGKLAEGFVHGWRNLLDFLVWFIGLWPFLLISFIGIYGFRRWNRKLKQGGTK